MKKITLFLLCTSLVTQSSGIMPRRLYQLFTRINPMLTTTEQCLLAIKEHFKDQDLTSASVVAIENRRYHPEKISFTTNPKSSLSNLLGNLPGAQFSGETGQPLIIIQIPERSLWVAVLSNNQLLGSDTISYLLPGASLPQRVFVQPGCIVDAMYEDVIKQQNIK